MTKVELKSTKMIFEKSMDCIDHFKMFKNYI